jgi:HEAT repeat protein
MQPDNVSKDFLQAAGLLEADLVWSPDFESLREPLGAYLRAHSILGKGNHPLLIEIVNRLLSEENDLTGE